MTLTQTEKLFQCSICGEFLRALEIMDNNTGEVKETMACPSCWDDQTMIGELLFGKYRVCE